MIEVRPLHHRAAREGPPPRSGEERKVRRGEEDPAAAGPPHSGEKRAARVKHRTLSASEATIRMARKLRKEMSPPERLLWSALRTRPGGFKFRKQHPFGAFAMDFCCLEARLCIEVDGDAHDFAARAERDAKHDARLLEEGYRTLRIPAAEVFRDLESVVSGIVETCRRFVPPRNGEVARRRRDGGVEGPEPETRPLHHRAPRDGPPPRSGEEQE